MDLLNGSRVKKKSAVKKKKEKTARPKRVAQIEKINKFLNSKPKITGAVIFSVGMMLLVIVAALVYHKITPESLSRLLPEENTIGFIEINIGNGTEIQNAENLLKKYDAYKHEKIQEALYKAIGINFENTDFVDGKIGLAFIKSAENKANVAVFIGVGDRQKAVKFLDGLALKQKGDEFLCGEVAGHKLCHYTLSYNLHLAFIKKYLVISPSQNTLLALAENKQKLSGSQKYIRVKNNLPTKNLAFIYIDAENLLSSIFGNKDFVAKKGYELAALMPFLKIFKSHGTVLVAQKTNFVVQTYTYLNKATFITFDRKYKAGLAKYVDKKPLAFFGGRNIAKQLAVLAQVLSGGEETKKLLFDGFIKAQIEKYLGEKISLEEDIYPVVKGEYAFAIEGDKEEPEYKFLIELSDAPDGMKKIKNLVKRFVETNAVFAPKVVEIELEDGTMAKEIVATEEEIEESSENYKGVKITSLKLGEKKWGIHYALIGSTAVFATTKRSLMRSIDLSKKSDLSFKESYVFNALVRPVLSSCDEVSFAKFDITTEVLGIDTSKYAKYLAPVNTIISGKNFFDDGIATTHYIIVK